MTVMNCEHNQQLASGFVDGELRADEIEILQAHLEACDTCRTFLENAYRVRDLLVAGDARGEAVTVAEGFAGRVSALVAREKFTVAARPRLRVSSFVGRVSAVAAAAVLVVSVGWSWLNLPASGDAMRAVAESPASIADEGSVASYLSEHALQSMDSTFLGSGEEIELASFEVLGHDFD